MNGRKNMKDNSKKIHLKDCSRTKNGIKYNYYALAESNKIDGKNHKKILKYLGILNEAQVESYRTSLKNINDGKATVVDIVDLNFEERKDFLDVLVLDELWKKLDFSKTFYLPKETPKKDLTAAHVAEILTISKLLNPSSHISTIDWFQDTYLSEIMKIDKNKYNKMKIFNELPNIEKCKSKVEQQLFQIARSQNKDEFEIFFIDGTTTYFEGTHCELGKPGKDKTTGFKTHTVLIMLITDKFGYPCAWDVHNGSAKEISKLKDVTKRICDDYKITNMTFCFDRGFASASNFENIESYLSKFISGIDKDQIKDVFNVEFFQSTRDKIVEYAKESKQVLQQNQRRIIPIDGFYTSDNERFYKELGVKKDYRYVAGFSVEIFKAEQANRLQSQIEAFLELSNLNDELSLAKKDRDLEATEKRIDKILESYRMQSFIEYTLIPVKVQADTSTVQSGKINYSLKTEEFRKAGLLDGLFIYITDHTEKKSQTEFALSAYNVTRHYKDKYVIEQNFRDLKNIINLRPIFVWKEDHVRAAISIAVIAQFMNTYIAKKVAPLNMSLSEFYKLLNKSSSVAILKTPMRTVNKLIKTQPRLMEALGLIGIKDSVFSDSKMAILK